MAAFLIEKFYKEENAMSDKKDKPFMTVKDEKATKERLTAFANAIDRHFEEKKSKSSQ